MGELKEVGAVCVVHDPQFPGEWMVTDGKWNVLLRGVSNAECWRFVDRLNNEPINPQEKKTEWFQAQRDL